MRTADVVVPITSAPKMARGQRRSLLSAGLQENIENVKENARLNLESLNARLIDEVVRTAPGPSRMCPHATGSSVATGGRDAGRRVPQWSSP